MATLTRPVVAVLESALATPTGTLATDIVRLRESLTIALQRCLDVPAAGWSVLVSAAAQRGGWDQWRIASLLAAGRVDDDPTPDETRDALAALADELIARRDVIDGPWEGSDRQSGVVDPHWLAGRDRRELVFAIERAPDHAAHRDAAGLRTAAGNIEKRDPTASIYPGLAVALLACADDIDSSASISESRRTQLRASLAVTPFAASVDQLG